MRYVQLERRDGGGVRGRRARAFETDDAGYFEARRPRAAAYRFRAFDDATTRAIGTSRTAAPTRSTWAESLGPGALEAAAR